MQNSVKLDNGLAQAPLLAGMTSAELAELARIARPKHCAAGEIIVREGEVTSTLWIVVAGRCEVYRRVNVAGQMSEVVLASLEPFENFGEISFFHPVPRAADVRAVTAAELVSLEWAHFAPLVQARSTAAQKLAHNTIGILAERLRRMDSWVSELVAQDGRPRRTAEWDAFREKLFQTWTL